ncbi:MAG TPA: ArsC family reductase [Burkholderiales bacterium]|jgi:Spx/MgsR family transcriptional regulator|nr:ArsC family reductase [Burkholderiales bacterium]
MEAAILYGIRNCDTVKNARAWLDQRGVEYRFHDYKLAGIDMARLDRWCGEVGWEPLLNRAGTTFRNLPPLKKESMNEERAVALMLSQPSVIKRPVLELNGKLIVGFKPELYKPLPW